MKLRDAQKSLQSHGMTMKKTGYGNEHRVNFKGGHEKDAYYSDDRDDAHATGIAMAKRAEAMRLAGGGSEDPMYNDSKKNK